MSSKVGGLKNPALKTSMVYFDHQQHSSTLIDCDGFFFRFDSTADQINNGKVIFITA
jgi:hypothetical protein